MPWIAWVSQAGGWRQGAKTPPKFKQYPLAFNSIVPSEVKLHFTICDHIDLKSGVQLGAIAGHFDGIAGPLGCVFMSTMLSEKRYLALGAVTAFLAAGIVILVNGPSASLAAIGVAITVASGFLLAAKVATSGQAQGASIDRTASNQATTPATGGRFVAEAGVSAESVSAHRANLHVLPSSVESTRCDPRSQMLLNKCSELRTPLTGLVSVIELLEQTNQTEQQRRLIEIMHRSADALIDVVLDLENLPLIENGSIELVNRHFGLEESIEDVNSSLVAFAREQNVAISLFLSSDLPSVVNGDEGRLKQVLRGLIGRSIAAAPASQVVVSATVVGREDDKTVVRFVIRDKGPSLEPRLVALLSQDLSATRLTDFDEFGSVGYSLNMTARLIDLMGGRMKIENATEPGVMVEFDIPLEVIVQYNSSRFSANHHKPLLPVLVVGKSEIERQIMGGYLAAAGCIVEAADSVWEAKELIIKAAQSGQPYKLVVVDASLSGRRESDFAREFRSKVPVTETGIIIVIDDVRNLDVLMAEAMGQWAFVTKPVRRHDLFAAAQAQIALQAAGAEVEQAPKQLKKGHLTNLRVLVAEDNIINQEVMRECLTEFGCTFDMVANGELAVSAFEKSRYQVVLMDIQMPVMDGLTASREIRKFEQKVGRPRIPIVAVSAHAFERERVKCMGANMDDFLSKPYTQDQLFNTLTKVMNGESIKRTA